MLCSSEGQVKAWASGRGGQVWALPHHWCSLEAEPSSPAVCLLRRVCVLMALATPSSAGVPTAQTQMLGGGQAWCLPEPPVFYLSWGRGLAHFPPGTVVLGMVQGPRLSLPLRTVVGSRSWGPWDMAASWFSRARSNRLGSLMMQSCCKCMLHCSVMFDSVTVD